MSFGLQLYAATWGLASVVACVPEIAHKVLKHLRRNSQCDQNIR
ncbi:MAG: hypothetical protein O6746_03195 [Thaumarchaeota archaeon]|nr:hypothetical protein [Nitrososphaerota archaeon]